MHPLLEGYSQTCPVLSGPIFVAEYIPNNCLVLHTAFVAHRDTEMDVEFHLKASADSGRGKMEFIGSFAVPSSL
jgi:hypothetical protein